MYSSLIRQPLLVNRSITTRYLSKQPTTTTESCFKHKSNQHKTTLSTSRLMSDKAAVAVTTSHANGSGSNNDYTTFTRLFYALSAATAGTLAVTACSGTLQYEPSIVNVIGNTSTGTSSSSSTSRSVEFAIPTTNAPSQKHVVTLARRPTPRTLQAEATQTSATAPTIPRKEPYDISVRAIIGNRSTMEDEYLVAQGGRLACVFDGHGGGSVSHYLRKNFATKLSQALQQKHWEQREDDLSIGSVAFNTNSNNSDDGRDEFGINDINSNAYSDTQSGSPSLSTHVSALRSTFEQLEDEIVSNDDLQYQGSTAVAVWLHESREGLRTILSANVGDSRAVLSRQRSAVELTRDHKPNSPREKSRILNMGETIEWDSLARVHRVCHLSLSRALGDRYAKPVVSPQVEIQHFPVDEGKDEFYLLASDGLWDVMTSQDVVDFVHEKLDTDAQGHNGMAPSKREDYELVMRRNMAKMVAKEALRRGSEDNICVLIVWLDKKSAR